MSSQYDGSISSLWCDVYLYLDDLNEQSIYDQRQEIKSIVDSML